MEKRICGVIPFMPVVLALNALSYLKPAFYREQSITDIMSVNFEPASIELIVAKLR